jgi:hypothetical protein
MTFEKFIDNVHNIPEMLKERNIDKTHFSKCVGIARETYRKYEKTSFDRINILTAKKAYLCINNHKDTKRKKRNKLKEAIREALELIESKEGWLSDDSMKTLTEFLTK